MVFSLLLNERRPFPRDALAFAGAFQRFRFAAPDVLALGGREAVGRLEGTHQWSPRTSG